MKPAGSVVKFDNLGRIVVPKPIRDRFGYENKTPVEVFTDEKGIYIQKYEPECLICGSGENIKVLNGKKLCRVCYEKLTR